MKRFTPSLIALAVVVAGCSSILGETPTDPAIDGRDPSLPSSNSTTTSPATECVRFTGDHSATIDTGAIATDALFLSGETYLCADDVVVVSPGDLNQIIAASQLAAALTGPLLFPDPRLAAELGRLKPKRIHLVGSPEVNIPGGAERIDHDIASATDLAKQKMGVTDVVTAPAVADATTVVETVQAIEDANRVVSPQPAPPSSTTLPSPDIDEAVIVSGLAKDSDASSIWLVDAAKPDTTLLAAAAAHSIGAGVVAIDSSDLFGFPEVGAALAGHGSDTIRLVGASPAGTGWELAVLTNDQQVPGGGFTILPEEGLRRYVAFYGHPGTTALGVLGEQGPAETRSLMQQYIDAYGGDGAQVIPTFEIIASVAAGNPTDDNDYSFEWPSETFDDWIEYARENDMYVVLDLQSGRDDFLSQAVQYQDLLELPFVGLALDPEWRLTDTQVHLNQTGTVDASEINETLNWVADLVRDNGLPQKMVLAHQFKTSMITNRDQLVDRPEIQLVIQMDGDGTEAQKNSTWATLQQGAQGAHWAWGWKNFFDEDEPGPPPPENVMAHEPTPVFVSYQ